ncbi:glutamate decarboxylase 2 [Lates japonicus]|uniref:glutamate decarboxylase n=1 Tax=Lates japonicus TaxID=270547 RepID=A0AAD3N3V6_LATJO|nr:glutamate decarboxylase 2 [Lates japonicus]
MASHGFWSLGGDNAGANTGSQSPSTPRAWCQAAAQKLSGGIGSKLCALLNVGEVEKPAEPGAKQPPQQTATAGNCGCNKSCNCTKAAVAFSDLYSTDLLPAMDGDTKTMTFLQEVVDILMAYIVESFDRETKVIDFHYPNELLQMNNWELQDEPATLDDILISCRATLKYAIKTGRPGSEFQNFGWKLDL